ncbi:hypothetical protein TVAG_106790 [Trichomonas vaginalis G3]|uniref:Uncharacterized protein n=1 Tax=Trichomonas vaginalis (strain ATCC PRA-98 / G3) TaxID=412133 RepID=A2E6H1_TRIV3|nr:hypothetical protein TVAGG3_0040310 [Trichomonas vaginalis G3]EAY11784.1 hypothetical protein TVAG_106790 [Trichomonas vaginalis G3]KAI5540653.1 hypothetical protein TVAGG3_0040310 [Trichomonas vaginalis G3]|eukprot:XP_001324007.1 hypothetical protein [Trichomonas vaginalis G3]
MSRRSSSHHSKKPSSTTNSSSSQYMTYSSESSQPNEECFSKIKNMPNLYTLTKGSIFLLALRNDQSFYTHIGYSVIPNNGKILISKETEKGAVPIDSMINSDGVVKHYTSPTPIINEDYKVPPKAVILRFFIIDEVKNAYQIVQTLLIDGCQETIRVSITGDKNFSNSFTFKQPLNVKRNMPPTYPYIDFHHHNKVREIDGVLRHKFKFMPEMVKNTAAILVCQVIGTKRIQVISSYPLCGKETIFVECTNDNYEPRTLDQVKFDTCRIKHLNHKLNTSFKQNALYPGMILIKLVRPNIENRVQVYDTLYPGPEVHDVKIRVVIPKSDNEYSLITTIPVPNTRIIEEKRERIDFRHELYKERYGKGSEDEDAIIEYYYYSDDEEEKEKVAVLPKLVLYVDDDGRIIDKDGTNANSSKLNDILTKMNMKGIKVNLQYK